MLTIKISETVTKERKVELPVFWKQDENSRKYVAVLNEKTAIKMYISNDGGYCSVSHSTPDFFESEIADAYNNYLTCTEQLFMEEYDDLTSAISLRPKLNESFVELLETVMK
jgi:hypothetical protein